MTDPQQPSEIAPILDVKNLSLRIDGVEVLRNVSMSVTPGERMALVGPNGAGKTALLDAICGLMPATSGRIYFRDRPIEAWPAHRRAAQGIGRSFQHSHFFADLSLRDAVLLAVQRESASPLAFWRRTPKAARDKADEWLATAALSDSGERRVRDIGAIERRRLDIIAAIAAGPALLLLDEPMAGLSPSEAGDMKGFLNSLDPALTLLVTGRDPDTVNGLATEIATMAFGEIRRDDAEAR